MINQKQRSNTNPTDDFSDTTCGQTYCEWMQALPSTFTTPLAWSSTQLSSLAGSNLLAAIPSKQKYLESIIESVERLCAYRPALFPKECYTPKRIEWAHFAVLSRSYSSAISRAVDSNAVTPTTFVPASRNWGEQEEDEISGCMIPMCDMLNHRPNTRIDWCVEGLPPESESAESSPEGKIPPAKRRMLSCRTHPQGFPNGSSDRAMIIFRAGSIIGAGHEVFNNYGPKSNEEFLLGYGFCLPNNDNAAVALRLGTSVFHLTQRDPLPAKLINEVEKRAASPLEIYFRSPVAALFFSTQMRALAMLCGVFATKLAALSQSTKTDEQDIDEIGELIRKLATTYKQGQTRVLRNSAAEAHRRIIQISSKASSTSIFVLSCAADRLAPFQLDKNNKSVPSINQYFKWLNDHGGLCRLNFSSGLPMIPCDTVLSCSSEASLYPTEALLSVPFALLITVKVAFASSSFCPCLSSISGLEDPQSLLALFVLHELSKGSRSLYAPFFSALELVEEARHGAAGSTDWEPSSISGTTRKEKKGRSSWWLHRSIVWLSHRKKQTLFGLYSQLFPALADAYPEIFPHGSFSFERFQWAAAVVNRCAVATPLTPCCVVPFPSPLASLPAMKLSLTPSKEAISLTYCIFDVNATSKMCMLYPLSGGSSPKWSLAACITTDQGEQFRDNENASFKSPSILESSIELLDNEITPLLEYKPIAIRAGVWAQAVFCIIESIRSKANLDKIGKETSNSKRLSVGVILRYLFHEVLQLDEALSDSIEVYENEGALPVHYICRRVVPPPQCANQSTSELPIVVSSSVEMLCQRVSVLSEAVVAGNQLDKLPSQPEPKTKSVQKVLLVVLSILIEDAGLGIASDSTRKPTHCGLLLAGYEKTLELLALRELDEIEAMRTALQ